MKTVTGIINSAEPISLYKAATLLSRFVSSENKASQDVSAYLRRASAAFTELKSIHRDIRSTNPKSEIEELGGAKGTDELAENETVTGDEIKEGKKKKKRSKENREDDVVQEEVNVKLEEEQRNKEKKERKSDGEFVSEEERKNKKKRKLSKEIDDA